MFITVFVVQREGNKGGNDKRGGGCDFSLKETSQVCMCHVRIHEKKWEVIKLKEEKSRIHEFI